MRCVLAQMIWSLLVTAVLVTSEASQILDASFASFVQQTLDTHNVPGVSIAVVYNDTVESRGYGLSKLPSTPATPDTLWYTASTTKAFTALTLAKIVEEKKNEYPHIKWTTPVSQVLSSEFVLSDEYATAHITLEDILSHRSGLPAHEWSHGWGDASTSSLIKNLRYLPFTTQPRVSWQYNNQMYATAGEVIQRLTGHDLHNVVREWIWQPLGMCSSTMSIEDARKLVGEDGEGRIARGYHWVDDHYIPQPYYELGQHAGAGAIISSVNDYALWMTAFLRASNATWQNTSSPVNAQLYKAVMTGRAIVPTANVTRSTTYALGWEVMNTKRFIIGHSGSVPGFGTQLYLLPDEGIGFVTMANTFLTSNQVGEVIFQEYLKRLGKLTSESSCPEAKLHQFAHLDLQQATQSPTIDARKTEETRMPLPGTPFDYTGVYTHPAYGPFNVSISPTASNTLPLVHKPPQIPISSPREKHSLFDVEPSPRTWPVTLRLHHATQLTFDADLYWRFGVVGGTEPLEWAAADCETNTSSIHSSAPECRVENTLVFESRSRAVFEYGLEGTIARLGIELESDMVKMAEEDGDWRQGMIWLEKLR